jgi:cytochrome P450
MRHIDTTSTTLTYLFWEFSRHPELQSRLRAELASKNGGIEGLPTYKHIIDLPVLDALIQEGLRLHPAAPASLPRETPSGGRVLNGVFIPEKVRIARYSA